MIITPSIPAELLPVGKTIKATAWEISRQPVFNIENYILGRMPFNIINTTSVSMDIDTTNLLSPYVYVRMQYLFTDDTISEFTAPFLFEIVEFIGVTNSSIIKIPKIKVTLDYQFVDSVVTGNLIIEGDEFRDYRELTTHAETIWSLIKDDGTVIHQVIGNYVTSPELLRRLEIPLSELSDSDSYTINVTYVGANATPSGVLAYKLQTYIINQYFDTRIIGDMVAGKYIYMTIVPKTTKFESVSLSLVDSSTGTVLSTLPDQATLFPKLMIPAVDGDNNSLVNGNTYNLVGSLKLLTGETTPNEIIRSSVIVDNSENVIDVNVVYLDKYSYAGTINTGINNIQCSVELEDGSILIGNNVDRTISRYKFIANRLVKIDTPIVIDSFENIGTLYLNIAKRNDGTIVVNYGANTKYTKTQNNVFRLYRYNPASQEFTLLNQIRIPSMGYGTSLTNSLVVDSNNDVFFIPGYIVDENEVKQALQIYKINGSTWTVAKTIPLPFYAVQNVSMVPTKEANKYLIFGGSENKYELDGKMVWKREQDAVYVFDSISENITLAPVTLETIDPYVAMMQGFLRKDGKVILFNASDTGSLKYDHSVYLIDTTDWTITHIANDLPDDYLYRTSIRMLDRSVVRISTTMNATNYVYHYPVGAAATIYTPIGGSTSSIIYVAPYETKYFNATDFEKVIVQGSNDTDTGRAIFMIGDTEVEYNYNTLIVGRDTTLTVEENAIYENVIVYNNATLTVLDV